MTAAISDFSQFAGLRASARQNDPAALRQVAQQFEALFVQSMLENMRGAQLAEPMFGSEQMDLYQGMFDKQIAAEMASGKGLGLAELLVRQLGGEAAPLPSTAAAYSQARPAVDGSTAAVPAWSGPDDFVRDVWPHAERAGARLGVAPQAIVAQAALETGWGAHVMRRGDGETSYNLFGIKAGGGWTGDSVAKPTLEYADGVASRRVERFRAYPDLAAAVDDYADLIAGNERYAPVRGTADDVEGFAGALQAAGYATDPRYARKITRVLEGETMQRALETVKNSGARPITSESPSVGGD